MREIALDTETTGLSYLNGDKLIEIGCVEIVNKEITGKTYHIYINPGKEVSADSEEITGLTWEFLKNYKTFEEQYEGFLEFIRNDRLVIHNAPFDVGFLNNELKYVTPIEIKMSRVVDTLPMARKKYPGSPANLDALCKRLGVDSSSREKHGVLIDAELLAQVYIMMSVERVQMNLFSFDLQSRKNEVDYSLLNNRNISRITPQELSRHAEFLSKIKNPIWSQF